MTASWAISGFDVGLLNLQLVLQVEHCRRYRRVRKKLQVAFVVPRRVHCSANPVCLHRWRLAGQQHSHGVVWLGGHPAVDLVRLQPHRHPVVDISGRAAAVLSNDVKVPKLPSAVADKGCALTHDKSLRKLLKSNEGELLI